MSYGGYSPYSDNGGGGGGRGGGYGSDPFDDRNALQYGGGNHEMLSFGPGNSPQAPGYGNSPQQGYGSPRAQNQNSTLDECIDIQNGIQDVENKLGALAGLQRRALDDADTSGGSNTKRELDNLTQAIMDQYRALTDRLKKIKSNPDSRQPRNVAQVNKTDRDLRRAIQRFQELEAGSRKELHAQAERQARIVHPDATDAEIAQMVDNESPVFQQAVMGSRAEHANRVLGAVKQRHQDMLAIEKKLMELLNLLDDMQELLTKQEVTVMEIDAHAEAAAEDMVKANTELETAVTTSRSTRKKKWICLGICVTIVLIIVIAVVAYILVNRAASGGGGGGGNNNNNNNNNNNGDNGNTNGGTNGNTDGTNSNPGATTGTGAGTNTGTGTDTSNTGNTAGQKRSVMQRNLLTDLQMNTARAPKIHSDIVPSKRFAGRRALSNGEAEAAAKKRFVVDWQRPDYVQSDN